MAEILTDLSPSSLLLAIQANASSYFMRRERILGKTITVEDGLTISSAPNQVPTGWLHDLLAADSAPERVRVSTERMRARGERQAYFVALEVAPCAAVWQAAGATGIETEHAMAISIASIDLCEGLRDDVMVETVSDDAGLAHCKAVISAGRDQWTGGFFELTNPSIAASGVELRYYLAWYEGRPVATAAQYFAAGLGGIWWLTTLPDVRGKGVANELTRAALLDARRLGYRAAMLESLPDLLPMYRRLGFREYCRIEVYRWKAD